jgi:hypothetical protein
VVGGWNPKAGRAGTPSRSKRGSKRGSAIVAVTVSKLRWLLGKATATLGDVRLIDLTPE